MGKYGEFKRKKDWIGKIVELINDERTIAGAHYPRGSRFFISNTTSSGKHGYHLSSPPCPKCGLLRGINVGSHMDFKLVENLPPDDTLSIGSMSHSQLMWEVVRLKEEIKKQQAEIQELRERQCENCDGGVM